MKYRLSYIVPKLQTAASVHGSLEDCKKLAMKNEWRIKPNFPGLVWEQLDEHTWQADGQEGLYMIEGPFSEEAEL